MAGISLPCASPLKFYAITSIKNPPLWDIRTIRESFKLNGGNKGPKCVIQLLETFAFPCLRNIGSPLKAISADRTLYVFTRIAR